MYSFDACAEAVCLRRLWSSGECGAVTSAEQSEARACDSGPNGTSRVASPLVMERLRCRVGREASMGSSSALVRHATTSCFAGGSATRNDDGLRRRLLRLRFAPPSANSSTTHLSPRRFTRREAEESERERAPEAELQQPASRERSNTTHLSPSRFTRDEAGQSEQKRRSRTKGSPRRQLRALQFRTSPSSARAGTESRREYSPCPSRR
jgi:hypothetical protein